MPNFTRQSIFLIFFSYLQIFYETSREIQAGQELLLAPKEPIELNGNEGNFGGGGSGDDSISEDQTKLDLGSRSDLNRSVDEGQSGEEGGIDEDEEDDEDGVKCIKCEKAFLDIFT